MRTVDRPPPSTAARGPLPLVRAHTGTLDLPTPLRLEHGGVLHGARVGYRLYGDPARPLVVVLGGISADRHVAATHEEPRAGWWQAMVGAGRPIDLREWCVLGVDWLGGCGATTGPLPGAGAHFPFVSTGDQAALVVRVLDALGVARAHAVVGASYGGMVALALGARHAARVRRAVVIGAPHHSHPMATALRSIQRQVVRLGLDEGRGRPALEIARGLAMITYRSAEEFGRRFDATPTWTADGPRFPVESYLAHAGATFAERCPPESFLCLSASIDAHRVDPAAVAVPTTLVAVDGDLLVPVAQLRELHAALAAPLALHVLSSIYGHDAFLKEIDAIGAIVAAALAAA